MAGRRLTTSPGFLEERFGEANAGTVVYVFFNENNPRSLQRSLDTRQGLCRSSQVQSGRFYSLDCAEANCCALCQLSLAEAHKDASCLDLNGKNHFNPTPPPDLTAVTKISGSSGPAIGLGCAN